MYFLPILPESGLASAFGKSVAQRTRTTHRKAASERETMEELRDRYEIIEEAASDAIVTIDEEGQILSISRAAERIFGYSVKDIVGQPVERIIPEYKAHGSTIAGERRCFGRVIAGKVV